MVSPWPFKPFTFRALAKTYAPMWVRWDVCRRYARLKRAEPIAVFARWGGSRNKQPATRTSCSPKLTRP